MGQTINKSSFILILVASLYAGPPMLSDDPFVPEYKEFEINIAAELQERDTTILTAPIFDINYGIYPDIQFTLESAYISSSVQSDFDALEVAVKYNFYKGDSFSIAIYPQYISYPINTIFDDGEVYALSIPMNISINDALNWIVNPVYVYPIDGDEHFELGTYLQYEYKKQNFYLEMYMEEAKNAEDIFTLINVGYLYQFQQNIAFMLSIGHEIHAQEKEATIAYLGLQFVF